MVVKQKAAIIVAIAALLAAVATSIFTPTTVFADEYPMPASGQCNEGDSPKADDPTICVTQ